MFHQNVKFPITVEDIDFSSLDLKKVFEKNNLFFKKVLVLTGGVNSSSFSHIICSNNKDLILSEHKNTDNSFEQIKILKELVYDQRADAILGIGGGKVLDTAKFLATKTRLPYFAVPTALTSDALASPISIIRDGIKTKGYPATIPSGILLDYKLVANAGDEHILSGLGDIISNLSALNDWDLAVLLGKAKPNNFARFLAEVSVNNILNETFDFKNSSFIKTYVNSIIMSGLAMNISGDSRPCSGSEHLIAHSLVHKTLANNLSHGILVGHFTPFCLHLQQRLNERQTEILKRISMKCDFISSIDSAQLKSVFENSTEIRGKRYTILNKYTSNDLVDEYKHFVKYFYK